ncbi:MAG: hypothetical protein PHS93_09485 [Candidatus Omnitrophica bacterium]|nr:hypothetical protein [Candidatus Omnitrophota bacterium]MDD5650417.1 hypothetical protein [Candidatus Nanoarchaeia archaeon]
MKNLIIILFFSLLLFSCSGPFYLNTKGYKINEYSLEIAWKMTARNISDFKYIKKDFLKIYNSPTQFKKNNGGNCSDFAIYLIYLLGPKANFISIKNKNNINHAIVEYNGLYIEPQWYGKYYNYNELNIIKKIDYYGIMELSTLYGTRYVY